MAFGASSKVFTIYIADMIGNTAALDYDADTIKCPVYNNTLTPDQTVAAAASAYATGVWSGNEVTSSTDLPAGGLTLASKTVTRTAGNVVVTAANAVSGSAATATVYGTLIYDDTLAAPVADQGMCYNSFGGSAVTVSAGTLTIAWDGTNGIMKFAA
jgi:hypothetical protein